MFTNNKVVLKELFPNKLNIIRYRETGRVKTFNIFVYGKRLTVEVEFGDGRGTCITCLGLLNSNKLLIKRIEAELMIKIKNIYLRNTKLNIKDEMSLKSIGIINNCTCLWKRNKSKIISKKYKSISIIKFIISIRCLLIRIKK